LRPARRSTPSAPLTRLCLEALEDRLAPAASPLDAPSSALTAPSVASASLTGADASGPTLTDAQRQALQQVVRSSTNDIWFEQNVGQFPTTALYGFRTSFGAMLVFDDHLQIIAMQSDPVTGLQGQQVIDVTFAGANADWTAVPGGASGVTGSYVRPDGTSAEPAIYNQLTLENVYNGVDLRLYSASQGMLEFDWLLGHGQDYSNIRIEANGQDGIQFNADGSATFKLRYEDLSLKIPESYQVIGGAKVPLAAQMVPGDSPGEIRYAIAGNVLADQPLVIDPDIEWSTFFDLDHAGGGYPVGFDSYLFSVAANANGVYCSGWACETITNGSYGNYMEVNAGFSQGTAGGQVYIYRFNNTGTAITAWTSTGRVNNNTTVSHEKLNGTGLDAPSDLEVFPDGRVLLGFNSGFLQIYSADLSQQYYNAAPVTMDTLNSVAIVDNNTFYASGRVAAAIPTAQIPAANIGPEKTYQGGATLKTDGVIIRYGNASATPAPTWATYVGGAGDEYFTTVSVTPDKTKVVFATNSLVAATGGYPALVNAVDSTPGPSGTTELLVGVLPEQATVPASFSVFSYLGGSGNEGTDGTTSGNNKATTQVFATNTGFYVGGNTTSTDLAGTTVALGGAANGAQTALGGSVDTFLSYIPINGSAGSGFQSTYLGGTGSDTMGGIAFDAFRQRLLVFGTTTGGFPTVNTTPAANYYVSTFAGGTYDIFIATLTANLQTKDYATYMGGTGNDYLGQTGDLIGQGHVYYCAATDLTFLATTTHSTDWPASSMGSKPGYDKVNENAGNDTHVIFAFNINTYDYGDAPATYEGSPANPAAEAIQSTLRIGANVDADNGPKSGPLANGDNFDDGIATLPALKVTDTSYSVGVSIFNSTGVTRTLQGWIDFNGDGVFEANERAAVSVPSSASQQTVTLNWSSLPGIVAGTSYLRLRFSDTTLVDNATTPIDERSIGPGGFGEVEDYLFPITPVGDLKITKTDGSATYTPGTSITYTIVATNTGPSLATGAVVADTIPAIISGATWTASYSAGSSGPASGSGDINASINLAAGGTATFTLLGTSLSTATGNLANTATITAPTGFFDPDLTNNSATDTDTPSPVADLSITKDDGSSTAVPGTSITYTIVATNNGPSFVTGATVADTLPATLGSASWTVSYAGTGSTGPASGSGNINATVNLAVGGTATFTLTATIDPAATGVLSNTATVAVPAGVFDNKSSNNSATDTDTLTPQGNLSITKSDGSATYTAGTAIQYTIVVTNAGPSFVTGAAVADSIPATISSASWTATYSGAGSAGPANGSGNINATVNLAVGGTATFKLNGTVQSSATGNLVNAATVAAPAGFTDTNANDNGATDTDTPNPLANLTIGKTDGSTTYTAGNNVSYTITVANTGPSDAQSVVMSDPLPAGTTLVSVTVPSGWSRTDSTAAGANGTITAAASTLAAGSGPQVFTLVLHTPSAMTTNLVNTATVSSPTDPTAPTATDTDTPTPVANLTISKDDGSPTYTAGTNVSYTITVANTGPSDAQNVVLSDPLPAGTTFVSVSLPSGWSRTDSTPAGANGTITAKANTLVAGSGPQAFTFTLHTPSGMASNLVNTATVSSPTDPTAPSSTDTDTPNPLANLTVTKDDGSATYTAGTNVSYTITVANTGPSDAQNVVISDPLPAGTTFVSVSLPSGWSRTDSTPSGANGTITAKATTLVAGSAAQVFTLVLHTPSGMASNLVNTATASSPTDPSAPSATDTDTPNPLANLTIAKDDGSAVYTAGTNTSYTITVANTGPSDAQNVVLSDPLPAGTTFVSVSLPSGWSRTDSTPAGANGTITAKATTLIAGSGPQAFTLVLHTPSGMVTNLVNTATVTSPTDPTAPSATDTDTPNPLANLTISKDDGSATYTAGTDVTYTITVANTGPSDAQNAVLSDPLPAGTTLVSVSLPSGWSRTDSTASGANGTIAAKAKTLVAGSGPQVFTLVLHTPSGMASNLVNTATVSSPTDPAAPSATDTDTPNPFANLSISKDDGSAVYTAGTNVSYTITVANTGPSDAQNVVMSDPLPAGTTLVSVTVPTGWSRTDSTPAGANGTITAAATTLVAGSGPQVFTLVLHTPSGMTTNLVNTAAVGSPTAPTSPSATDTDTPSPLANLTISKTDGSATYTAGTDVSYTITVADTGPSDAQNVVLSDPLPAGTTLVSVILPSGWSRTDSTSAGTNGTITAKANALVAGSGPQVFTLVVHTPSGMVTNLVNTATVTSPTDPTAPSATDTDTPSPLANLTIVKDDNSATYTAGTDVSYTITVANSGPSDARNVVMSDPLPAGTTLVSITVPNGWSRTDSTAAGANGTITAAASTLVAGSGPQVFTLVLHTPSGMASNLVNTATVSSPTDPTAPSATDTDTPNPLANLTIAKDDGSAVYTAGTNTSYTITVANTGPSDAQNVVLSDPLPAGTTFVSVSLPSGWSRTDSTAAGANGTITAKATTLVAGSGPQAFTLVLHTPSNMVTNLVNTATVTSPTEPAAPSATDTDTPNPLANLTISKDDNSATYTAGTDVSYTITVANSGPSDARNVVMSDPLPAGTTLVSVSVPSGWSRTDSTAVGANGTITAAASTLVAGSGPQIFTLVLHTASGLTGNLVNTATVSSPTDPSTPGATDSDTANPLANLTITKDDGATTYTAGNNVSYTITVANTGPSDAQSIVLSDPLPAGTTLVSVNLPSGWSRTDSTASGANGTITATATTLVASSGPQVFTLVLHTPSGMASNLVNTATVSSPTDPMSPNASDTDTPNPLANLAITKNDGSTTYTAGTNVGYTITVANTGPSDAQSVFLSDPLPAGTTLVSVTVPSGWSRTDSTATGANGTITATATTLAAGSGPQVFTLVLHTPSGMASSLVNTATVSSPTDPTAPSATDTDAPNPLANLIITKDDGSTTYTAGTNVSYTITVANTGPSDAQNVLLSDPLPAGTTLVSVGLPSGWTRTDSTAAGTNGTITATATTLAASSGPQVFTLALHTPSGMTGNLVNTATVNSPTDPIAPTATDTDVANPLANLIITKDDSSATYTAGTNVTYTITVANTGPSDEQIVVLTDPLPAGTTFVSVSLPSGWTRSDSTAAGTNGVISATATSLVAGSGPQVFMLTLHTPSGMASDLVNTATVTSPTDPTAPSATDTDTPDPLANLTISKDDGSTTYTAGTDVSYTITVANTGPSDAQNVVLSDPLPAGTTLVSVTVPSGWSRTDSTAGGANGTITAQASNLVAGSGPQVFTLVLHTPSGLAGNLVNTAAVASPTDPTTPSATDTDTANPLANLSISKDDGSATYTAGTNVTYTITVANTGPSDAQNVVLIDPLPAGATLVSVTLPSGWSRTDSTAAGTNGTITATATALAAGSGVQVFTLTLHTPSGMTGNLVNTATVTSPTDPTAPSATDTDTPSPLANLTISKTDGVATYTAGTDATYTITVANTGPSDAQSVVMSDPLPAGTTLVSVSMPAGWSRTDSTAAGTNGTISAVANTLTAGSGPQVFTLVVHTPSGMTGNLVNTATASSPTDPSTPSATDSDAPNPLANLSITKDDGSATYTAGTDVSYAITVANTGPSDAQNVVLSDPLPAGTTLVSVNLPTGWSRTDSTAAGANGTITATATTLAAGSGPQVFTLVVQTSSGMTSNLVNTATVSSPTDPMAPSASDIDTPSPLANLTIAKDDGSATYTAGADVSYTITVANSGPSDAQSVAMSDPLPAGTTLVSVSLPSGWSRTDFTAAGTNGTISATATTLKAGSGPQVFTLVVHTPSGMTGNLVNSATASSPTDPTTPSATDTDTPDPLANLTITKDDGSLTYMPGTDVTYTITVSNTGPSDAQSVTLNDPLPAGSTLVSVGLPNAWSRTDVTPAGANGTISAATATLTASSGPQVFTIVLHTPSGMTGVLVNTASATSPTDPAPATATDTDFSNAEADLTVTKDDGSATYTAGTDVTYTITVNNLGPADAQNVVMSDPLPAGATFVSLGLPSGWTRTDATAIGANGTIAATSTTVGAGSGLQVFTLVVHTPSSMTGNLVNTATVTSPTDPLQPSATDTDTPNPLANLTIAKDDGSTTYTAGTDVTYTITVANTGASDAQNVVMNDPLPAGSTLVSFTLPSGWWRPDSTPIGANGTIMAAASALPAGSGPQVFTLVLHTPSSMTSNLVNTAIVSSPFDPVAPSATDTDTPSPLANLSITKDDGSASYTAGTDVTYTITVANTGPSDAQNAVMSDPLPAGTTLVSVNLPTGWSRTDATAAGANGTITAVASTLTAGSGPQVFTLVVHTASGMAGNLVNTATVSSPTDPTAPAATDSDTPNALANLSITKDDGSTTYTAGTDVSYTITVANTGPSEAQNVVMSDPLPAGTTLVSVSLPAGWSRTDTTAVGANGTITAVASALAAGSGPQAFTLVLHTASAMTGYLANTATVSSPTDPTVPSATDTDTPNPLANLRITKDDGSATFTPGTDVTYTITVANTGPSDAQNVVMSDPLPAGATFVSVGLPSGWTRTDSTTVGANGTITASASTLAASSGPQVFTLTVHTASSMVTSLVNTATVGSPADPTTPSASDADTPTPLANLTITKDDGIVVYTPGSDISYTITVANTGPSDAQSVVLSDPLPAGTTFVSVSLPSGWTRTDATAVGVNGTITANASTLTAGSGPQVFTLVLHTPSGMTGNLVNTATVGSPTDPIVPSATDTDFHDSIANLSVTKTDGSATYTPGTDVTYTITVANPGPADAQSVVLTDPLPAGTTLVSLTLPSGWSRIDSTAVGASGTISASMATLPAGSGPQVFTLVLHTPSNMISDLANTATLTSPTDPVTPTSTDTDTAPPLANLTILKTDSSGHYTPGGQISYAITVANIGPSDAQNVVMSDPLPAGTTFVSLTSPSGWTRTDGIAVGANGSITASIGTLPAGSGPQVFTLVVSTLPSLTGTLVNTASVTSPSDPTPPSSTDTDAETATLTGTVFVDNDNSGTLTSGDTGLGSVLLALRNSSGNIMATATSGPNGAYSFANVLLGNYTLTETQPNGYGSSTPNVLTLNVPHGGLANLNFGDTLGSLAGLVFFDPNNNGAQDTGEPGLGGASVSLTGTDVNGTPVSQTMATLPNGTYRFAGLLAGTYAIKATHPAGFASGIITPGSANGTVSPPNSIIAIGLGAGVNATGYTFAEYDPILTGSVFIDANDNGVRDPGEPGIANTTITLTGTNVFGTSVTMATSTDTTGAYQFPGLAPGVYTLTETQPAIPGSSPPALYVDGKLQNGVPAAASLGTNTFQNIDLTQTAMGGGYNFGELRPSSLSGFVYVDANNNGVRDAKEPPIAGVTVVLTGTNDRGQAVNATVVTDKSGSYSFQRLRPGTYTLREVQPAAFIPGHGGTGVGVTDPGVASANLITGVVVGENQTGTVFRFSAHGLKPQYVSKRMFLTLSTGALSAGAAGTGVTVVTPRSQTDPSGFVYVDTNNNGAMDPGEAGLRGVQVILTGVTSTGATVRLTTTTDATGFYHFDNLDAGVYTITVVQPHGYRAGKQTLGNHGGVITAGKFTQIVLGLTDTATGYNFGELHH
jgi:uncharacterized repeat protein (TIGR01451 family)